MSKFRPWQRKQEKRREKLHNTIRNKSVEHVKALLLVQDLALDGMALRLCVEYRRADVIKFLFLTNRIASSWVFGEASTLLKFADGELFEIICKLKAKDPSFDLEEYGKECFVSAWKWRNYTLVKYLVDRGCYAQIDSTIVFMSVDLSDKAKEKEKGTLEYVYEKIMERYGIEYCLTSEWQELRKYAKELI